MYTSNIDIEIQTKKYTRRCLMKYSKEERLKLAEEILDEGLSQMEAAVKYDLDRSTISAYVREYRVTHGISLPPRIKSKKGTPVVNSPDLERYKKMSKDELIDELILAKVNEARLKKGYEVKGAGQNKEYSFLSNKSSK